MDALVSAYKAYQGQTGPDEKQTAARRMRELLLALSPRDVAALQWDAQFLERLRALLVGTRAGLTVDESGVDASKVSALRLAVLKSSLGMLSTAGDAALSEGEAHGLVSTLAPELGSMVSSVDICEVVDAALELFEIDCPNACAVLELLPTALLLIGNMVGLLDVAADNGGTTTCQASDYCQGVMRRVCQHNWPAHSIAKVLVALRDYPLNQETLQAAVQKAVARAKLADVHDLPAVVHQLLMLAAKGCRDTVLLEVVRLFEQREAAVAADDPARRRLLEVEGSVLLHIDMAAKHDAELGQAWVRYLRSDSPHISSFMLAVSFVLASIQRFEQPATDALKALIVGALRDSAALTACPWLPTQHAQQPAQGASPVLGPSPAGLRDAVVLCVRNSAHGQGGIVQPMAQLAVALMEAGAGDKAACYLSDGSLDETSASPAAQACDLGTCMLLELFCAHKEFRRDIISMCHNRLIGAKDEAAAPFVRLIALLVRQEGAQVAEYLNDFKVSLENLAFLPPNAALSLLLAVWPLCRARRDVQDYLVMLLRKAMFSREVHARLLAARGFLYMIIEELKDPAVSAAFMAGGSEGQAGSSSQVPSMSQMSSLTGGPGGATLLHELMSFLRRCLSQQAEVRRALYEGMPAVLAADPSAQECIVEPLLPHFCQFYETNEQLTPPLKLEACARLQGETVRVVEPLQHLLAALRRVLRISADLPAGATEAGNFNFGTDLSDLDEDAGAAAQALQKRFQALRHRLVNCTLEDFSFDGSTDFSADQPAGELSQATADILLGCMEVAMEDLVDEITAPEADVAIAFSHACCGSIPTCLHHKLNAESTSGGAAVEGLGVDLESLFSQHQRLLDLAAEGKKGSKAKKVEGLTQAVGGRRGGGRPAAPAKAGAGAGAPPSLDRRVPALSVGCLCKLLGAISVDNARLKLARDTQFQTFVLSSTLRLLQACAASDTGAAIATGTAGSKGDRDAVHELLAVPPWEELAGPLFSAVQTVVLACAGQRVVVPKGEKKEKDPTEPLTQAAVKALEQLFKMGKTAAGVAELLRDVPLPDDATVRDAGFPTVQGLPEAQHVIAQRLPHIKQLLDTLVEHCCGKELEALCPCLQLVAGVLPGREAACVAGWAVKACEGASPQAQLGGAAKALVSLALRCASQAGVDPRHDSRSQPPGRDVALLQALAGELKQMHEAEDEAQGSDMFPVIQEGTAKSVMAVLVSHMESLLTNMDWVLAKLKVLMAAGKDCSLRQSNLRMQWERAAFERLRYIVESCGVMVETRILGATCESLLKATTHLYKTLGAAAKSQFAPKGVSQCSPCQAFQELVAAVNRCCTGQVYSFITDVHSNSLTENDAAAGNMEEEGGDEKAAKAARKRQRALATAASKARRESKLVPNLVFQIEDYEKQLIRLSKTGKMNLMLTAKRSTNRDFKLTLRDGAAPPAASEGQQPRQAKRACRVQPEVQQGEEEEGEGEGEEVNGDEEQEGDEMEA
ncbi:hypothetical protein N2152v2_005380 [Parachlorella kessleri]